MLRKGIILTCCMMSCVLIWLVFLLIWLMANRAEAQTVMVDGVEREFIIHVPSSVEPQPAAVVVLHGGSSRADGIRRLTDFDDLADEHGFIAVYPYGLNQQWNDGREGISNADDLAFFDILFDTLIDQYAIDPARIFVTGMSNGGFMAMRLACARSERVSGVAIVTATFGEDVICQPQTPLAMLIMNGTDDPLVPYDGGEVTVLGTQRGLIRSTDDTISFWVNHNRCTDAPNEVALPNSASADGTRVYRTAYSACDEPVVLYRISGGGHAWPGGGQYLPRGVIGRASQDIDASAVIWGFFIGDT